VHVYIHDDRYAKLTRYTEKKSTNINEVPSEFYLRQTFTSKNSFLETFGYASMGDGSAAVTKGLSSFVKTLSNPNVFRPLPGNSLMTFRYMQPIIL